MYGYIYKTTNLINGKIYIGKRTLSYFDPNYKGSGKDINKAFNKHGWDNFLVEFLIPCFSREELNAEEIFLIDWFDARNPEVGYNRAEGGEGGNTYASKSPDELREIGEKISSALSGIQRTPEQKENMSAAHKGVVFTDSWKQHISESLSGRSKPEGFGDRVSAAMKGKPKSEDHKRKISEACSDGRRKGSGNPMYGRSHPNRGKIWVNKDGINKVISTADLDFFLSSGFSLGMIRKISWEKGGIMSVVI